MNKTSWVILLLLSLAAFTLHGQGTRLYDTQFNGKMKLSDCIDQLEAQFGLEFSYPAEIDQQEINLPPLRSTPSLESYLNQLFLSIGFEYQVIDEKKILLRPRKSEPITSEESWTWEGKIRDELTGEAIMYTLIQTADLTVFTFSDEQGNFKLALKPKHTDSKITVHALGYNDQFFIPAMGALPTEINLAPTDLLLSEVTILESKPGLQLSGSHLQQRGSVANSLASPAGIFQQDLFREIQMLSAGVSAHDDSEAGLKIRGGNTDETLIVLNEIPIYRADHFYGIFSGVNSNYIEEFELYKNANPVEYGGKLSGMLDLHSAETIDEFSGELNADLLAANGSVNIPLGKQSGLLLGGRSSYTNLTKNKSIDLSEQNIEPIGDKGISRTRVIVSQPDFDFYDGNLGLFTQLGNFRAEVNGYASQDNYINEYSSEFRFGSSLNILGGKELFVQSQKWKNLGGSYKVEFEKGSWIARLIGYSTEYTTNNDLNSNIELKRASTDRVATFTQLANNSIQDRGAKIDLQHTWKKHQIKVGLDYIRHQTALSINSNGISAFDREIEGREMTSYTEWQWKPDAKWQFQLGNRLTYFKKDFYPLPQIQVKYLAGKKSMLKASVSKKAQFVREITFQDRLGQSNQYLLLTDKNVLPVGQAWNYMLGGALYFSIFTLDAELYLKNTTGVLAFSSKRIGINQGELITAQMNDFRVHRGSGQTKGLDLSLQYNNRNYSGFIAYTLSESTNRFPNIYKNKSFASALDSRHQLKLLNNYEWRGFNFFAAYIFADGRPYTDISSLTTETLISDIDPGDLIKRLPDYHRLDAGLDYSFPIGKTTAKVGLSCFNLTNHANVKYLQYIYSLPNDASGKNAVTGTEALQLERTWNVSLGVKF